MPVIGPDSEGFFREHVCGGRQLLWGRMRLSLRLALLIGIGLVGLPVSVIAGSLWLGSVLDGVALAVVWGVLVLHRMESAHLAGLIGQERGRLRAALRRWLPLEAVEIILLLATAAIALVWHRLWLGMAIILLLALFSGSSAVRLIIYRRLATQDLAEPWARPQPDKRVQLLAVLSALVQLGLGVLWVFGLVGTRMALIAILMWAIVIGLAMGVVVGALSHH